MIRKLLIFGLALLVCLGISDNALPPQAALAACRVKTRAVVANTVAIAPVPLAVSIGVPVAQVAPYYYSYSDYSAYATPPSPAVDVDALATKLAEKLAANGAVVAPAQPKAGATPAPQIARPAAQSLIGQKCAQCHSGAAPKGNLSLENPAGLDCPTRLKAIRAILSEKMPQGGPRLTPGEAGKLLEELVGQ